MQPRRHEGTKTHEEEKLDLLRVTFVASCLRGCIFLAAFAATAAVPHAENWPQWRGPSLNGVSGEKNLPVRCIGKQTGGVGESPGSAELAPRSIDIVENRFEELKRRVRPGAIASDAAK